MAVQILLVILCVLVGAVLAMQLLNLKNKKEINAEQVVSGLKAELSAVSMEALTRQNELGGKELEEKKKLIDQRLDQMKQELDKVETAVRLFSNESGTKMTGVDARLNEAGRVIKELRDVTGKLNETLSSASKRGEWGQRSAKQILDLCGMKEGVNYTQQESTKEGRPDFTFLLPNGIKLNLDCKFPLDNYAAYVKSENASEKETLKKQFLKDVRGALKGLSGRDYIDPNGGTVDYSVMFIANEQVFNFVNEHDGSFIDDAMKAKVVVCSPFTLYAVVAIIFKASENYKMEKAAKDMVAQILKFKAQWEEFKCHFDAVGASIDKVRDEFEKLKTTRVNKLEVPLRDLERLE